MPRPLAPSTDRAPESADFRAFAGLAGVLEPDSEDDPTTSVSMKRARPPVAPPVSIRAPVQVQDFAFADTVFAKELPEDDGPPNLPIFFDDVRSNSQCVTPLAFPLPEVAADVDLATRRRVFFAHVRHGLRRSLEEMRELWGSTADIVHGETAGEHGLPRASAFGFFVRRLLALWSCFQWSRADLLRAGMIGVAVFLVAGAAFAATTDLGSTSAAGGTEVRSARTLDQHTARKIVLRAKR